jgi:3'-phosphoadenosine 5'-phosphosulfate sulfotransferase (PAPS reductase)/FAD synthetase
VCEKSQEQVVDEMIAEGLRVMQDAIELYKPTQIVAAYSSGDDSIVSTHFTMEHFKDAFVFNASTLVALTPARCHLVDVCNRMKWQLEVGEAVAEGPPEKMKFRGRMVKFNEKTMPSGRWMDGATAYEEFVLNFAFPGRGKKQHARMYQRLKERPIARMLKRFNASKVEGKPKVMIVSGIRGDESAIRAGYKRAHAPGRCGDVWVNPFYYRTAADFAAYRDEFGLPRNPVKKLTGISGECCCGSFGSASEREAYKVADPAFEKYLCDLEQRAAANGIPNVWATDPPRDWVAKERIWKDFKRGQEFLFPADERIELFQPMCVGCNNGRR